MIARFLAEFIIFFFNVGLLFNVLVGGNWIGYKATSFNIVKVVIRVGDVFVGFV